MPCHPSPVMAAPPVLQSTKALDTPLEVKTSRHDVVVVPGPAPSVSILPANILASFLPPEREIYKLVFSGEIREWHRRTSKTRWGMGMTTNNMALYGVLEEVWSTGVGEFSDLRAGRVCYRRGGPLEGGMMVDGGDPMRGLP
ncbi:hypothetical protein GUJ93_ZPchr0007g4726 [Zizania palustris]|uniref:Uncharacterized protein n=1 Tax=Zizania palustris TaxID=103762 RepID=A0A8J5SV57_ZIZPA|nr:hypothetical protein GUJ93_ZPchr0007g4726 [Zizania palustris]